MLSGASAPVRGTPNGLPGPRRFPRLGSGAAPDMTRCLDGARLPARSITVAPTGAETAKSDAPALPVTLEELVGTAKACEAAGAGLVHVHIRDDDARPTLDLGRLRDTVAGAARADLPGRAARPPAARSPTRSTHRLRVLEAEPDSCSLTCGTINFGDDVFSNPWPFMAELYQRTQAAEVVPEFELFDLGHVTVDEPAARHLRAAVRRARARRPRDGCPGRHARYGGGAGRRGRRAARGVLLVAPPASGARRCRSRWPRSPRAATCGSAWRTR